VEKSSGKTKVKHDEKSLGRTSQIRDGRSRSTTDIRLHTVGMLSNERCIPSLIICYL